MCAFFLLICRQAGENECELRILVHQSLAGCVIGRGGTKIKELKDVSAAFLLLQNFKALINKCVIFCSETTGKSRMHEEITDILGTLHKTNIQLIYFSDRTK